MPTPKNAIRFDAFVENARPDPKSTEALVLLQGYIGKSDLEGHIRVYSDPELSDFIELPEQEVCYAAPVSPEEDPLGGSRLWVRKTTVFTSGNPNQANRVKSSFLEGDIVQAYGDTANIPGAVLSYVLPSKYVFCQPTVLTPLCGFTRANSPCQIPTRLPVKCPTSPLQSQCCISKFNPPCDWPSRLQPSCYRTCGIACTAIPLCNIRTETCPPTILMCPTKAGCPSVAALCPTTACPSIPECPTFGACPSIACQTDITVVYQQAAANQAATLTGYEGGFNPYMTGY